MNSEKLAASDSESYRSRQKYELCIPRCLALQQMPILDLALESAETAAVVHQHQDWLFDGPPPYRMQETFPPGILTSTCRTSDMRTDYTPSSGNTTRPTIDILSIELPACQ